MNSDMESAKKDRRISLVSLLLLLMLLVYVVLIYQNEKSDDGCLKLEGTVIETKDPIIQNGVVMTDIPGYPDKTISKHDREIQLINPERNQVLFKYTIVCNDKFIYQTEFIAPGNMVSVDLYKLLEQGSYAVILKVETLDIQTKQTCNSANIHLNLTVEK